MFTLCPEPRVYVRIFSPQTAAVASRARWGGGGRKSGTHPEEPGATTLDRKAQARLTPRTERVADEAEQGALLKDHAARRELRVDAIASGSEPAVAQGLRLRMTRAGTWTVDLS